MVLFPQSAISARRIPPDTALQSFVLEALPHGQTMFVILNVSTGSKEKGLTAGLAIGSVIALAALFAGLILNGFR